MKIVALLGESSVGKNFIQTILEKDMGYHVMVSHSTRPIRSNEFEGQDYYFIDTEKFQNMMSNNELLEHRSYNTIQNGEKTIWYYGLAKSEVKDNVVNIVIVDLAGFKELKTIFKNEIIGIYITAPLENRRLRAKSRDKFFEESEFNRRAEDDEKVFKDVYKYVDLSVKNVDFEDAISQIKTHLSTIGV